MKTKILADFQICISAPLKSGRNLFITVKSLEHFLHIYLRPSDASVMLQMVQSGYCEIAFLIYIFRSLKQLKDYFINRRQQTRVQESYSSWAVISPAVPY